MAASNSAHFVIGYYNGRGMVASSGGESTPSVKVANRKMGAFVCCYTNKDVLLTFLRQGHKLSHCEKLYLCAAVRAGKGVQNMPEGCKNLNFPKHRSVLLKIDTA